MNDFETKKILLVDDDSGQRSLLSSYLKGRGYITLEAEDGKSALEILQQEQIDLMISDVRMPGMNGLELLANTSEQFPDLPTILVTAYADIRDAVKAVQRGAVTYLEKPIDFEELCQLLVKLLPGDNPAVETKVDLRNVENVVVESPCMRNLLNEIALVAPTTSRVLITGESGVGKEVIARLIHDNSECADGPLVSLNCAAIPETLIDSELFGHEKGAFTGAETSMHGRFEQAIGGTLFLDEVGELPLQVQAKLLRVLQEKVFRPLGGAKDIKTDARIIAATNRNLEDDVEKGLFREDLFYRLNVFELYIPPLRERTEDIIPLAKLFMAKYGDSQVRLATSVVNILNTWEWPGNVRELQNAMERAVLLSRGGVIMPEHLPRKIKDAVAEMPVLNIESGRMDDMERCLILQTLQANDYNRTETAKVLGFSRRTLIYKLNKYRDEGHKVDAKE